MISLCVCVCLPVWDVAVTETVHCRMGGEDLGGASVKKNYTCKLRYSLHFKKAMV